MAEKSHEAFYIAATAGAMILLWWVWKQNNSPIQAAANPAEAVDGGGFPIPWASPMTDVYDANPTAYQPPSDADLTLNVANPYLSMLGSDYMPLFGFVGVAQGMDL
jgi:hypothetical protein